MFKMVFKQIFTSCRQNLTRIRKIDKDCGRERDSYWHKVERCSQSWEKNLSVFLVMKISKNFQSTF